MQIHATYVTPPRVAGTRCGLEGEGARSGLPGRSQVLVKPPPEPVLLLSAPDLAKQPAPAPPAPRRLVQVGVQATGTSLESAHHAFTPLHTLLLQSYIL